MPNVLQTRPMKRDAMLNVRIPADVKRAIKRAGDDDHGRSVSGMVVRILREWCIAHGYLAAPKSAKGRA